MEIREFAERVLLSESLEEKFAAPGEVVTDDQPGESVRIELPARPPELRFHTSRRPARMPHPAALSQPRLRAVAHHIMANHELQALEVMAWVLCAFPQAPPDFRQGMVTIMRDEQRHTRLHIRRIEQLGLQFGDKGVNGFVWKRTGQFDCLLDYLACLPLLFEGANLDHSLEFERRFLAAGDVHSARVTRIIHRDEIGHVAFGLEWLRRLKPPGQSDWEAFSEHVRLPLRPSRARGNVLDRSSRRAAGMTDEFIDRLEQVALVEEER